MSQPTEYDVKVASNGEKIIFWDRGTPSLKVLNEAAETEFPEVPAEQLQGFDLDHWDEDIGYFLCPISVNLHYKRYLEFHTVEHKVVAGEYPREHRVFTDDEIKAGRW